MKALPKTPLIVLKLPKVFHNKNHWRLLRKELRESMKMLPVTPIPVMYNFEEYNFKRFRKILERFL